MCFFFQQDLFFTERIWKVHCLKPVFTYFDHHFVETSLSNRNSVILAAFFAQKASVWSNFMCSKPWCVARRDPRRRGGGNVGSTRWVRMVSDDISNPKAFLSRWYSFFKGIMLVFWRVYGIRYTGYLEVFGDCCTGTNPRVHCLDVWVGKIMTPCYKSYSYKISQT